MMLCRVLGPVQVESDGGVVDIGGPVPRRMVAALVLASGRPVPDGQLAEQVWGDEPPVSLPNALRVVVSRLRSALGPGGRRRLTRTAVGYALVLPTDQEEFARLVDEGGRCLDRDPTAAERALTTALELWRGEPFADLGDDPGAVGARSRLQEMRAGAVDDLLAARLGRGEAASAVAALSEAVTEAPYRERRWELLALALYRTGRQGHALAELRRVRALLVDELGVEPGPALRDLERRMLRHDPSLLPLTPHDPATGRSPVPGIVAPRTSFVGRDAERDLVARLLVPGVPVTLVGPGGVGKTRLAIEVAARRAGSGRLVRLADVHDPDAVAPAVAAAVGLTGISGDPAVLVGRALAGSSGLLVLDNCEHLVAAVGRLVLELSARCPSLRMLVTSRMPLGVDGERVVPVEPLPPEPAVALLIDRVRAGRAAWTPSEQDLGPAHDICATLDGLPLAIELAAARERAFGLAGVAAHLRDRVDLLGTTPRGSVNPHSSLDAAIRWSVDALDPADRGLLLRLWPFEGGFPWEAAAAVHPETGRGRVLAALAGLVERSVVVADNGSGPGRFRLLETVRRFCRDTDPDAAATAEAHARWVRGVVARATAEGDQTRFTSHAVSVELANIRAGLSHDLAHHPLEALRSASSLEWAWPSLGLPREGCRVIGAALQACPGAPDDDVLRGLVALSLNAFHVGEFARAAATAEQAVAAIEKLGAGYEPLLAKALGCRGLALAASGDVAAFRATAERYVATAENPAVPEWIRSNARLGSGIALLMGGERERGEAELVVAKELSVRCGYLWGQGTADLLLAWSAVAVEGRTGPVTRRLTGALAAFQEQGNQSDTLAVVYAAAHQRDLDPVTAVTLRAAAAEHAAGIGADPARHSWLGGPAVADGVGRSLAEAERERAETAGRATGWDEMIALFHRAVGAVRRPSVDSPATGS